MSNETKRDVFDETVKRLYYSANYEGLDIDAEFRRKGTTVEWELQTRYDTALPDDLPVIPGNVGEYIKNLWKYHHDLVDVFGMVRDLGITRTEPNGVLIWVAHNTDDFARAWVLGVWRIEETGEVVKL